MIDTVAQQMVDFQAQGMTLAQIAGKVGLPEAVCYERMKNFLESAATNWSTTQLRMLQLRRLERVLGALDEQVMSGDLLTQGRNVKNLIETINQISELMDLKRDRLRDEQVRLLEAQSKLVLAAVDHVKVGILADLLAIVPPELHEEMERIWSIRFGELAAEGIEANARARVLLGQGAGPLQLLPVKDGDD